MKVEEVCCLRSTHIWIFFKMDIFPFHLPPNICSFVLLFLLCTLLLLCLFPSCLFDILRFSCLAYCCQAAGLVFELRQKWQNLFIKRIRCPSKPWSQQDEAIIRTLVSVRHILFSSSTVLLSLNSVSIYFTVIIQL